MKIASVMFGLLMVLTIGAFVQVWRQIPEVNESARILAEQASMTVRMGLSSAETPSKPVTRPAPSVSPTPAR